MQTPDDEAGRLTERIMLAIHEHIKPGGDGKHPDPVHHYNRAYGKVYDLLREGKRSTPEATAAQARQLAEQIAAACQCIEDYRHPVGPSDEAVKIIEATAAQAQKVAEAQLAAQEAELAKVREALNGLRNNVHAVLTAYPNLRDVTGVTNVRVLEHWRDKADAALKGASDA